MGLFKHFSNSCFDAHPTVNTSFDTNQTVNLPDPSNYKIIKFEQHESFLAIFINYPDCTNYEGNKILCFAGCTLLDLYNQKDIDPHFSENTSKFSPFARFIPTEAGWRLATELIKTIKIQ